MLPGIRKEELKTCMPRHCSQGHSVTPTLPHLHNRQGQASSTVGVGHSQRVCVFLSSQKLLNSIPLSVAVQLPKVLTYGLKIAGANLHVIYLGSEASETVLFPITACNSLR